MQEYVMHRPDAGAMEQILASGRRDAAAVILRLAWQLGLVREEIETLRWDQVDLLDGQVRLGGRSVPIEPELAAFLAALREERNHCSEYVVISDRDKRPLRPQSISRLARTALDELGQTQVRLIDLRHDFIVRQLSQHDWQYVSRISGNEAAALSAHFAAHTPEKRLSTRIRPEQRRGQIDEFKLWKLLQEEGNTPAGLTLWLTWQLGLQLEEITTLRWDQVDLAGERLNLPGRSIPLSGGLLRQLRSAAAGRAGHAEYVVVSPRAQRPFERTRLSRLTRTTLVNAGLDNVSLRDLRLDCDIRIGGENQIVSFVRQKGAITRKETMELLGVSRATAYSRLKQMVRREKLTQVGMKYYLHDAVVPPERHSAVIREYLDREGFAYRQDIARALGIQARQCQPILKKLVAAGEIVQDGQKYYPKVQAAQ